MSVAERQGQPCLTHRALHRLWVRGQKPAWTTPRWERRQWARERVH